MSFYGLGPKSPALKHTFPQNNTYGNVYGSLPLFDWLTLDGGIQALQPELPPSSDPLAVSNTFTDAGAPGLQSQPTYIHSHAGFSARPVFDWNAVTDDADDNHVGPLMKKNLLFSLGNEMEYHWYSAVGNSLYSFQQFVFAGNEAIQLGSNVRRVVYAHDLHGPAKKAFYRLLRRACGETDSLASFKDPISFSRSPINATTADSICAQSLPYPGRGAIPSSLSTCSQRLADRISTRSSVSAVFPITDSVTVTRPSLRPSTRCQSVTPWACCSSTSVGSVVPTFSDLSLAHLRQDGGLGATFRVSGVVVAQTYIAWGAGHGPTLGYSFTKLF